MRQLAHVRSIALSAAAALVTLVSCVPRPALAGTYFDLSGTVTTGGTSQQIRAVSGQKSRVLIANPTTATENLFVNTSAAASTSAAGSIQIAPGGALTLFTAEAINITAATTGHAFIVKDAGTAEMLLNPGSGSGGGTDPRVAQASATSGQTGSLIQAAATTAAPTYSNGTTNPLSVDTAGNLRVNVVTGSTSGSVAQASTTAGQSGGLIQGAVTTSAPTYTTGQTNPLSLTTAGEARTISTTANTKLDTLHADFTAANTQLPAALGQQTAANSLSVTFDSNTLSASANSASTRLPVSLDLASPVTGSAAAAAVLSNMPFAVGKGAASVVVNVTAISSATVQFEASVDGTAAYISVQCWASTNSGGSGPVSSATTTGTWYCPVRGTHFQVRQSSTGSSTATVAPTAGVVQNAVGANVANTLLVTGSSIQASAAGNFINVGINGLTAAPTAVATTQNARAIGTLEGVQAVREYTIPEREWSYAAAASGIVNTTTAVTIKAAASGSDRNYVTSVDLMCEALTNATEVAIRDGAGGTVLWRTKVGTGGLTAGRSITFRNPLRGSTATLLEVLTLTASGAGACYFNATGYVAP